MFFGKHWASTFFKKSTKIFFILNLPIMENFRFLNFFKILKFSNKFFYNLFLLTKLSICTINIKLK